MRPGALLLAALCWLTVAGGLRAQDQPQAGVVVTFADGHSEPFCVALPDDPATGYDVLRRTGLDLAISAGGLGTAVCRIADTGCPADDCFCQCQGADCLYWSYWHLTPDGWDYSRIGAHAFQVTAGSVEGWTWGPGSVTAAKEPPALTLADICAAPTAAEQGESAEVGEGQFVTTPRAMATPPAWLSGGMQGAGGYLLFGLLMAILGGALWRQQRRPKR